MTRGGGSVVVCRAPHQAQPLIDALTAAGVTPIHTPLLEVVPPLDGGEQLRRVLETATPSTWLAFTSANGVDAVARVTSEVAPAGRVAVVGGATAARVESLGWQITAVASVPSAAGLGASLPVDPGDRVIAPVAELASTDLLDALTDRGITTEVVTAYRTIAPEISAADGERIAASDVIVVTAPSVIDRLVHLLGAEVSPALVAIGPTSAAAIERHGLAVAARAHEPSVSGLVDAVVRTLRP